MLLENKQFNSIGLDNYHMKPRVALAISSIVYAFELRFETDHLLEQSVNLPRESSSVEAHNRMCDPATNQT